MKLEHFLAGWDLRSCKERFHQLAFTANDHGRKSFEPFMVRDFRLSVEPISECSKLFGRNLARLDAVKQMIE